MRTRMDSRRCLRIFVRIDLILAVACTMQLGTLSGMNFYCGFHSDQSQEASDFYKIGTMWLLAAGMALSWSIFIYRFAIRAMEENDYPRCFNWFCYQVLCLGFAFALQINSYDQIDDKKNLIVRLLVLIYPVIELWTAKQFLELLRSGGAKIVTSEMV